MNVIEKEFHCPVSTCKQADFLPFECNLCFEKFCIEHRTPESHNCPKNINISKDKPKINPKNTRKCGSQNCNTKLTPVNEYECKKCGKMVCLKHRFEESHECGKVKEVKKNEVKSKNDKIENSDANILNEKKRNNVNKKKGFFSNFWCCYKSKKPNKL